MSWIQTYTGKAVDPFAPAPADLCIEDIAHALSNICRFTGHCRAFYSVAQHSLEMAARLPRPLQLAGLLHDASEAYLCDVARPLKQRPEFAFYRAAEAHLQTAILHRLGGFAESAAGHDQIKALDLRLLEWERQALMGPCAHDWNLGVEPAEGYLWPMSPQKAEHEFLKFYAALTAQAVLPAAEPLAAPVPAPQPAPGNARAPRPGDWSAADLALLREHAPTKPAKVVAQMLGRSTSAVYTHAGTLGICFGKGKPHQAWTPKDIALLRTQYPAGTPLAVLAAQLGRKASSVQAYAYMLQLRRTANPAAGPAPVAEEARVPLPLRKAARAAPAVPAPAAAAPAPKPALALPPTEKKAGEPAMKTRVRQKAKAIVQKRQQRAEPVVAVTAAFIRTLAPNDPRRHAYNMGGVRGYEEYQRKGSAAQ